MPCRVPLSLSFFIHSLYPFAFPSKSQPRGRSNAWRRRNTTEISSNSRNCFCRNRFFSAATFQVHNSFSPRPKDVHQTASEQAEASASRGICHSLQFSKVKLYSTLKSRRTRRAILCEGSATDDDVETQMCNLNGFERNLNFKLFCIEWMNFIIFLLDAPYGFLNLSQRFALFICMSHTEKINKNVKKSGLKCIQKKDDNDDGFVRPGLNEVIFIEGLRP